MDQKVFAVHDMKLGAYANPFVVPTKGIAIRSFEDVAKDPKSEISVHPEDYSLWYLGDFIPDQGLLVPAARGPERLIGAHEFIAKEGR